MGTAGDCNFAEYAHGSPASGTCEVDANLTGWQVSPSFITGVNDFFVWGTSVTHPASQTGFCATLPGTLPPTFTDLDSLVPVSVGHQNLSGFFGTTELQIQETVIH